MTIKDLKKNKICNRRKTKYFPLFHSTLNWFTNKPASSFTLILISGGSGLALFQLLEVTFQEKWVSRSPDMGQETIWRLDQLSVLVLKLPGFTTNPILDQLFVTLYCFNFINFHSDRNYLFPSVGFGFDLFFFVEGPKVHQSVNYLRAPWCFKHRHPWLCISS